MKHKSKRGIRNKRAISTVVASILVLAITVALAVGLLTFGSSFMGSQEKMSPPTTDQIKVENIAFTASSITVTVRNVGTSAVTVDAIYVNGAALTVTSQPINPGAVASFGPISGGTYTKGQAYTVKAASSNGAESTYTAIYT